MNYTLRLEQVGALKLKADVRIPAGLVAGTGLKLTIANGVYTFDFDYSELSQTATYDPATSMVVIYDPITDTYETITLADFINNSAATIQVATGAGNIIVLPATQVLIVNRTVDENPSDVTLPLSTAKIGPLKIVDWKGNAGTFPHTINRSGGDVFQGGATTRKLAGDRASTVLHPVPGLGYAA